MCTVWIDVVWCACFAMLCCPCVVFSGVVELIIEVLYVDAVFNILKMAGHGQKCVPDWVMGAAVSL